MSETDTKLKRIVDLYVDGFRSMTIGRSLWLVILIKLAIIFLVLKIFFFPDKLATAYDNDEDRADAVRNALTLNKQQNHIIIYNFNHQNT